MASRKKSHQSPSESPTPSAKRGAAPASLRFSRVNLILGAAGLVALALGYVLLAQGSITAAPLLLVLGYVFLVPLAIIL
jgi:hypothetical protein